MERRISAGTNLGLPFAAAAAVLDRGRLPVLLGIEAEGGDRHPRLLASGLSDGQEQSQLIEIELGEIIRVGDPVVVGLQIVPLEQVGVVGALGPFQGRLELRGAGPTSTLRVDGTYAFTLPRKVHFGDGLLLHRSVRRALTQLLVELGAALCVEARATSRAADRSERDAAG